MTHHQDNDHLRPLFFQKRLCNHRVINTNDHVIFTVAEITASGVNVSVILRYLIQ